MSTTTPGTGGEIIPFEVLITMDKILIESMVTRIALRPVVAISVVNVVHDTEGTTDEMA